jgi:type I restriction enzyme M protein
LPRTAKPKITTPQTAKRRKKKAATDAKLQPVLPVFSPEDETLDLPAMETWLWDAACQIRGATDAPKFKDFILPLIFYKRLSDVYDDELQKHAQRFGSIETARQIVEKDHQAALKTGRPPIIRFIIPEKYTWSALRNHGVKDLGEYVSDAVIEVARLNPDLAGVVNIKDYNETQSGQRTLDDDHLSALVEVLSQHRLGMRNVQGDLLGRAYEYLLRKFAEGQGSSAGEFYTPEEVSWLLAVLIDPQPRKTAYDPACGSAGLITKVRLHYERQHPDLLTKAPRLYGQELNPVTYALAKMNMFLHGFTDAQLAPGDTFRAPAFALERIGLKQFDYAAANPMWNQKNYDVAFFTGDKWGRFVIGSPTDSSADWAWVQHIQASLNERGRAAIVLDTGAVSRGSGSKSENKEREIRKTFVENDWIEAVVLLPENLFYNTTAAGIILLVNLAKQTERAGQILLINASLHFEKKKPKNVLTEASIQAIAAAYRAWETCEKLSRVVRLEEVRAADYNLSPSQFVEVNDKVEHRDLSVILRDMQEARTAREKADAELATVLLKLGLQVEE